MLNHLLQRTVLLFFLIRRRIPRNYLHRNINWGLLESLAPCHCELQLASINPYYSWGSQPSSLDDHQWQGSLAIDKEHRARKIPEKIPEPFEPASFLLILISQKYSLVVKQVGNSTPLRSLRLRTPFVAPSAPEFRANTPRRRASQIVQVFGHMFIEVDRLCFGNRS